MDAGPGGFALRPLLRAQAQLLLSEPPAGSGVRAHGWADVSIPPAARGCPVSAELCLGLPQGGFPVWDQDV